MTKLFVEQRKSPMGNQLTGARTLGTSIIVGPISATGEDNAEVFRLSERRAPKGVWTTYYEMVEDRNLVP